MGEMGSVAWMFKKRGVFDIDLSKHTEDQVVEAALEAGAEDVVTDEGGDYRLYGSGAIFPRKIITYQSWYYF